MKTFQMDSRNAQNLLTKVVTFWLQNDSEKSWNKLADALERSSYKLLADNIRKSIIQEEQNIMVVQCKFIQYMNKTAVQVRRASLT